MTRVLALTAAICLAGVVSAQSKSTQSKSNGYLGSEECKACHPDIQQNFYKNPHFKSVASRKEPPERTGCEGCHGAGREHAESFGEKAIGRVFSKMNAQQSLDACLACHANDFPRANIRRSDHTLAAVACNQCHSIHRPRSTKALLAKKQTELCYGCHQSVRAQFSMPVKHRVNEGTVECSDCHNPHGTFAATWGMGSRPHMVKQSSTSEQPCLDCHTEKRGPFLYEHTPMRVDGCQSCHVAHGSMNSKLLKRPVVFTLCLECHNGVGKFGSRSRGIALEDSSHNMLDPRYQKCTTCHAMIHGSNSDQTFFR